MSDLATFNKYDDLEADTADLDAKYEAIIKFKRSLEKIELLISLSEDADEKSELEEMKNNIVEALNEQTTNLRAEETRLKVFSLSMETLKEEDTGKLAKCYITVEKKWKNSVILELDLQEQTAKISIYGQADKQKQQAGENSNVMDLPAYKLKVLKDPPAEAFKEGVFCKAIYSGDGQFYPCTIEKIDEEGYHVRYKKYGTREVVALHRLREIKKQDEKQEYKFENLTEFVVPEKYKILPNDPENVIKTKKAKVKALKFAFKNAQIEEDNKQKQNKWLNFNSSAAKTGHFVTKHNVSVINKEKQIREKKEGFVRRQRTRYDNM